MPEETKLKLETDHISCNMLTNMLTNMLQPQDSKLDQNWFKNGGAKPVEPWVFLPNLSIRSVAAWAMALCNLTANCRKGTRFPAPGDQNQSTLKAKFSKFWTVWTCSSWPESACDMGPPNSNLGPSVQKRPETQGLDVVTQRDVQIFMA